MVGLIALLKDPYERKARVMPGLLVVLPVLVPLVSVYGPKHVVLTAVMGLLVGCGAIHALANVARIRGKIVQERLIQQWGGMPTTVALRHRDGRYDIVTKARYHELIASKLGLRLPSSQEEAADPAGADQIYTGACVQLREMTRHVKALLLAENIAYGFHRNMLGMRVLGVVTSTAGIFYGLLSAKVLGVDPFHWEPTRLANPGLPGGLTLAISTALLAAWLFHFNSTAVRHAADAYTDRLFEALAALPARRSRRSAGAGPS